MNREKKLRLTIIFCLIFGCITVKSGAGNMEIKNVDRLDGLKTEFRRRIVDLLCWAEHKFEDDITIACAYRSAAEQDLLYLKGSSTTTLKGGQSKHQHGLAVDLYFVQDGKIVPYNDDYEQLGEYAEGLGLIWGGRWKAPFDPGHFELRR